MLKKLLTHYADLLNEFLKQTYRHPEGMATVGRIGSTTGVTPNKLVISLLNVEREAAVGSAPVTRKSGNGAYTRTYSPLLLSVNVVLASVFPGTGPQIAGFPDNVKFVSGFVAAADATCRRIPVVLSAKDI